MCVCVCVGEQSSVQRSVLPTRTTVVWSTHITLHFFTVLSLLMKSQQLPLQLEWERTAALVPK